MIGFFDQFGKTMPGLAWPSSPWTFDIRISTQRTLNKMLEQQIEQGHFKDARRRQSTMIGFYGSGQPLWQNEAWPPPPWTFGFRSPTQRTLNKNAGAAYLS
jgi:hypothetical protein